jgi:predicted TIM-barrel fold metal-dependent hydrolase
VKEESRRGWIIDSHAIVGAGQSWTLPSRPVEEELEFLLKRGSEAEIDRHCIVAARTTDYQTANKHVALICNRYPGKFTGIAAHHPEREAGQLRRMLLEEIRSMGLRAVRSDGHPTRELLDIADEFHLPVIYYPEMESGHGPARWFHIMVATYPKVNFILPHLGFFGSYVWWPHMEALDLVKRYSNVYLDTSGIGSWKYLEMAVQELPQERILFGTCAPALDPRVEIHAIHLLKLNPRQKDSILGGNILRLIKEVKV